MLKRVVWATVGKYVMAAALGVAIGACAWLWVQYKRGQEAITALDALKTRYESLERENAALYRVNERLDQLRAESVIVEREIQKVPVRELSPEEDGLARRIFE